MKIFLSWSGEVSREVALILRDWIPSVIQSVDPYVSSEDIDKGARWSSDIAKELESSSFGILCVTSENINAPWLNFEAGALSKTVEKSRVCPFLFGVKRSEIKEGPVLQFQSAIYDKEEVFKMLTSVNYTCGSDQLEDTRLNKVFEVWWPQLKDKLDKLESRIGTQEKEEKAPANSVNEILEEILELTRYHQKLLRSPEELLPPDYLRDILMNSKEVIPANHPAWTELRESLNYVKDLIANLEPTEDVEKLKIIIERIDRMIRFLKGRVNKAKSHVHFDLTK